MSKANLSVCEYYLSQYHAGQIVTPTARIWCDGDRWHSLVVWHDASDRSKRRDYQSHETQNAAEAAINAEVIVSSEGWQSIDGRKLAKLAKLGEKNGLTYRLQMNDDGECLLDGEIVSMGSVIQSIVSKWRTVTIQKFDRQFRDWQDDVAATSKFRDQLAAV